MTSDKSSEERPDWMIIGDEFRKEMERYPAFATLDSRTQLAIQTGFMNAWRLRESYWSKKCEELEKVSGKLALSIINNDPILQLNALGAYHRLKSAN